ncbi:MAG: hypothetical protein AAGJ85_04480, partial [Pseudomonadota bacterium]
MTSEPQISASGHEQLPTIESVDFQVFGPRPLHPLRKHQAVLRFTPSRPCLGLSVRLYLVDETGQAQGRIRTKNRHLGGEVRRGSITLLFTIAETELASGRYDIVLEIKNFRTSLYEAKVGEVEIAPGCTPPPLDLTKDGKPQHRDLQYWVKVLPDPDETVPKATRAPWKRQGRPVWAYLKYKRNIHGGYQKRPLGLHIHIPKCGGTTFRREILPVWYPDPNGRAMVRDVFAVNYVERDELFCAPPSLIDRLLLITGHDSYGAVPAPDKGVLPICFFRDPFDRAASLWNHHVKGQTSFGQSLQKVFSDEADFLNRSDLMQDYWRSFLTFEELLDFIGKPRSRSPGKELRDVVPDYYQWLEATARQRIADLPFVLLTEKFDESMVYMHLAHGFPLVPYKRQRVNRSAADVA